MKSFNLIGLPSIWSYSIDTVTAMHSNSILASLQGVAEAYKIM